MVINNVGNTEASIKSKSGNDFSAVKKWQGYQLHGLDSMRMILLF